MPEKPTKKRSLPWQKIMSVKQQRKLDDQTYGFGVKEVREPVVQAPVEKAYTNYVINRVKIQFPFKAYGSQIGLMGKIIKAIINKENALLESPTGTGKTLSILVSAIAWIEFEKKEITKRLAVCVKRKPAELPPAKAQSKAVDSDDDFQSPLPMHSQKWGLGDKNRAARIDSEVQTGTGARESVPKIYVATRTQKQIEQMVNELKTKTNYAPKMSILGSREHYCVNPKVKKSATKNEDCEALVKLNNCSYYQNSKSVQFHRNVQPGGVNQVWDIEVYEINPGPGVDWKAVAGLPLLCRAGNG